MVKDNDISTPAELTERQKAAEILGPGKTGQEYFSIRELADRWRCSRGTVYNRLRAAGAQVLDFAAPGKKGKKAIPARVLLRIESRMTKKLT